MTELGQAVRRAVIWRSGSQIASQMIAWASTLAVIRILDPSDYGLFAMTQVVLAFLSFLNGYGFASSLVQDREVTPHKIRQAFGMLMLVNLALALLQIALAPLAAAWYRQPMVADLLMVQAIIYLATPFTTLPEVLLVREMDFRRPAIVTLIATAICAAVAIACAVAGYGVWTLVFAPLALFWTRGIGMMIAARLWIWPSFSFAGARDMFNYGVLMLGSQLFWTIITQADVFIASRSVAPHELGLYAEALFLTTIISSKFVPPLNQVAFPAYARLQQDRPALRAAFLKSVRLIMLITAPLYFGLAIVAQDLVELVLGQKWSAMAPLVQILALGMPALTLHILIAPAVNAVGRPDITLRASMFGAALMFAAFLAGVQWGISGLAWAWLLAFPLVPAFAIWQAREPLGITWQGIATSAAPAVFAGAAMVVPVAVVGQTVADWPSWSRLIAQVSIGGLAYIGLLFAVSRATLVELVGLLRHQRPPEAQSTT